MAGPNFQMIMQSGPNQGKTTSLEKSEIFIGRDLGNDIVINDPEVSRRHARMVKQAGGYVVEDMGSTNGTTVNGQRLTGPHLLRDGDVVTLGENVRFIFEEFILDPDSTVASPATRVTIHEAESLPSLPIHSIPASPSYTGQVPSGPSQDVVPQRRNPAMWIGIVLLSLLAIGCICGGILWYIDTNALWCDVMPFIPGCP
jgi:predicted component of type VI protein secretion system